MEVLRLGMNREQEAIAVSPHLESTTLQEVQGLGFRV